MKLPLKVVDYYGYAVPNQPHSSAIEDADGERIVSGCFDPNDARFIIEAVNDTFNLLRIAVAARGVIDHRARDYLDNTISPYSELKAALDVFNQED